METALLSLADDHLILGQRTAELCGQGPSLEEELALANLGLDLIGQARGLFQTVAERSSMRTSEDKLAFFRHEHEYQNLLLVEQPNEDFAHVVFRNFAFSSLMVPYWGLATSSRDPDLAAIAAGAEKESIHHRRHAAEWVVRLGDGTEESRARLEEAMFILWPFCGELFEMSEEDAEMAESGFLPDRTRLKNGWFDTVSSVLHRATMAMPEVPMFQTGGRAGRHTEHLGPLLAVMQHIPRSYPEAVAW